MSDILDLPSYTPLARPSTKEADQQGREPGPTNVRLGHRERAAARPDPPGSEEGQVPEFRGHHT